MHSTLIVPTVGVVCFVAGIVFSKAMLSEATAIKQHITAEIEKLRSDVSAAVKKAL